MKKALLKQYAKLIASVGANVKKGDYVSIMASVENADFVCMVVDNCYKLGAKDVEVRWISDEFERLRYKNTKEKDLCKVENWELEKMKLRIERKPVSIFIDSENPDAMKGVDQKKLAKAMQTRGKIFLPYREELENKYKWVIAAIPGEKWAKKVFPNLKTKQAVEALWEAILKTSRAYEGDPKENWRIHNANLAKHCEILNNMDIDRLEYKASNGTDLSISLIKGSRFAAGEEKTMYGESFNPNMPSEEVFTSPDKNKTNGIVYASKPLVFNGEIIDKFWIKFENGKVVDCHAEVNDSLLKELINMDEGASYLGECAIVPFTSPVNQSGLLFYNTLFDENAVCHLALGRGFNETLVGYENMTNDEIKAKGINNSMVHEDFMIGTEDLTIVAVTRNGERKKIFEGNWLI